MEKKRKADCLRGGDVGKSFTPSKKPKNEAEVKLEKGQKTASAEELKKLTTWALLWSSPHPCRQGRRTVQGSVQARLLARNAALGSQCCVPRSSFASRDSTRASALASTVRQSHNFSPSLSGLQGFPMLKIHASTPILASTFSSTRTLPRCCVKSGTSSLLVRTSPCARATPMARSRSRCTATRSVICSKTRPSLTSSSDKARGAVPTLYGSTPGQQDGHKEGVVRHPSRTRIRHHYDLRGQQCVKTRRIGISLVLDPRISIVFRTRPRSTTRPRRSTSLTRALAACIDVAFELVHSALDAKIRRIEIFDVSTECTQVTWRCPRRGVVPMQAVPMRRFATLDN